MCCRQVEGPIGMLFASAVFLRSLITLIGELRTPKLPKFLPKRNACAPVYTQRYYTARPIWTNEGSKRVIPRKDVPFGGLNVVPLNFGSQTLKMIFLAHEETEAWTTKSSNTYNFNKAMMTKFLHETANMKGLRG